MKISFKSTKNFTTSDWGKAAIVGILSPVLQTWLHIGILWQVLLGGASLLGWISLIVWIYRKIKKIP